MNDQQLQECYQFIQTLTKQAGEIVKKGFSSDKVVETKSSLSDLVTNYDKEVEELLIASIKAKYPTHLFIGEESTAVSKIKPELTNTPTWLIDPIDGTTNFVHGFPMVCVSIALAIDKQIVIGIVYNPVLDQMFTALRGNGAYLNGTRLTVSKQTALNQSIVCLDFHILHLVHHYGWDLINVDGILAVARGIRSLGSAALALAYVAMGSVDAYVSLGLQSWDVAAGILLVKEAGGSITSTQGTDVNLFGRNCLATSTNELRQEIIQNLEETKLQMGKEFGPRNRHYPLDRIL